MSSQSLAKKLIVAYGNSLAPWVMQETNNGILLDIMNEAMEPLGYDVEAIFVPYARRIKSFKMKKADVVCDINQNNIKHSQLHGFFSGIIYAYKNYAYTLKKHQYHFTQINELTSHSVLAWQGANEQLGDEYRHMALNNPFYRETFDQKSQVKMLMMQRIEVIQLDHQIFEYYFDQLVQNKEIDASIAVDRFALFGENPNGFLFNDLQARNDFVTQIQKMKKEGRFIKIFQRYMREKVIPLR